MKTMRARILTLASCTKMHDHGGFSMLWTCEENDPFALLLHAEGTNDFWQLDRLDFSRTLLNAVPGVPLVSGVASAQLRLSDPAALSLRLATYHETGEDFTHVICSAYDVARFLDNVNKVAPRTVGKSVDEALAKIFT